MDIFRIEYFSRVLSFVIQLKLRNATLIHGKYIYIYIHANKDKRNLMLEYVPLGAQVPTTHSIYAIWQKKHHSRNLWTQP